MLPLCTMFLTFFLSRTGSLSAFIMREEDEGIIETVAWRFTTVSFTVTLSPFQSAVAFMMSSPTFLGERPRGPIFGARDEAGATSPPTVRIITILTSSLPGGPPMVFIDDVLRGTTPAAPFVNRSL